MAVLLGAANGSERADSFTFLSISGYIIQALFKVMFRLINKD